MKQDTTPEEVKVVIGPVTITGHRTGQEESRGVIIFAHGSGSSRFSPRNNYVAHLLQEAGYSSFLFDLLTAEEDAIYENRFNIDLLTERLVAVTEWVGEQESTKGLQLAYFGASTGAASALKAAGRLPGRIQAVVSRGGRPDLAIPEVEKVTAPVLLLVGSLDDRVIELNEQAYKHIHAPKRLTLVPGASHLFEEPGKLEEVAHLAINWYRKYL